MAPRLARGTGGRRMAPTLPRGVRRRVRTLVKLDTWARYQAISGITARLAQRMASPVVTTPAQEAALARAYHVACGLKRSTAARLGAGL